MHKISYCHYCLSTLSYGERGGLFLLALKAFVPSENFFIPTKEGTGPLGLSPRCTRVTGVLSQ